MRCPAVLLVNGDSGERLPFVWEMPLVKLLSILSSLFVALAVCFPCLVQVWRIFGGLFPMKLEFQRWDLYSFFYGRHRSLGKDVVHDLAVDIC